ncbi:MAG: hypothetical protein ACMUIA_11005 [bacterium]
MCEENERKKRLSMRAYFTNMKSDIPRMEKARLLARNSLIRLTRGQSCCGHPGEPGC